MWNDFNNSDNQASYDVIPNNTLAKVRMQIRQVVTMIGIKGGVADTQPKTKIQDQSIFLVNLWFWKVILLDAKYGA